MNCSRQSIVLNSCASCGVNCTRRKCHHDDDRELKADQSTLEALCREPLLSRWQVQGGVADTEWLCNGHKATQDCAPAHWKTACPPRQQLGWPVLPALGRCLQTWVSRLPWWLLASCRLRSISAPPGAAAAWHNANLPAQTRQLFRQYALISYMLVTEGHSHSPAEQAIPLLAACR